MQGKKFEPVNACFPSGFHAINMPDRERFDKDSIEEIYPRKFFGVKEFVITMNLWM